MHTLTKRLHELAELSGEEAKALRLLLNGNAADLNDLLTEDRSDIVSAINELVQRVAALEAAVEALTS